MHLDIFVSKYEYVKNVSVDLKQNRKTLLKFERGSTV